MEKCRLQQTYNSSKDEVILALQPLVRSGRKWKAGEELVEAGVAPARIFWGGGGAEGYSRSP